MPRLAFSMGSSVLSDVASVAIGFSLIIVNVFDLVQISEINESIDNSLIIAKIPATRQIEGANSWFKKSLLLMYL